MHQGRLRLRPWLEEQIDSGRYPGVVWLDQSARVFQIPWKHAARHGWNIEKDATLFRNWAIHTGRFKPGIDKPDPKTWKANFRCALNSLTDVKELQDRSMKKGHNAFRVYTLLPHCKTGRRRKALRFLDEDSKAASPTAPAQRSLPLERFTDVFWKHPDEPQELRRADLRCVEEDRSSIYCSPGLQLDAVDEHEQTEAVLKIVDHLKTLDHWSPSYESERGWRSGSVWMGCLCEPADCSGFSFQTDCSIHHTSPSAHSDEIRSSS